MYETFNFIINLSYTRHNMLSQSLSVFFFIVPLFLYCNSLLHSSSLIIHSFLCHTQPKKGDVGDEQLNKINKLKVNKQQMKTTYNN